MTEAERVALGRRMKEARLRAAVLLRDKVSQDGMARLVSAALRRSLKQSAWSDYELGVVEPPLDVIRATARLSGLTPEYITFGVTNTPVGETGHIPTETPEQKRSREAEDAELAKLLRKQARAKKGRKPA